MKIEILTEDQAVKGYAYPVEVKVYEAGAQLVPASATITIKEPDGTAVISAAAMAVGAGGTLTYTLEAAKTLRLWEAAIMEIAYVVGAVSYKAVFFFDVVLNALKCNVVDDDLKKYFPLLQNEIWAGTSNYSGQIDEAFRVLKRLIKDRGRRPAMLIDGAQVRELIIIKTFELIFFSFAKDPEDVWWKRYEQYRTLFNERFGSLVIKYDEDESGTVETDEKEDSLGQTTLER